MIPNITIYTDGACRNNPGPGGWGALLCYTTHRKSLSGAERETTNNRMELMAAICALVAVTKPCKIALYTDSQYVKKGVTEWLSAWKRSHWKKSNHQSVKNVDLWKRLDEVSQYHYITWYWIKGHQGHPENEFVDRLANQAIDQLLKHSTE